MGWNPRKLGRENGCSLLDEPAQIPSWPCIVQAGADTSLKAVLPSQHSLCLLRSKWRRKHRRSAPAPERRSPPSAGCFTSVTLAVLLRSNCSLHDQRLLRSQGEEDHSEQLDADLPLWAFITSSATCVNCANGRRLSLPKLSGSVSTLTRSARIEDSPPSSPYPSSTQSPSPPARPHSFPTLRFPNATQSTCSFLLHLPIPSTASSLGLIISTNAAFLSPSSPSLASPLIVAIAPGALKRSASAREWAAEVVEARVGWVEYRVPEERRREEGRGRAVRAARRKMGVGHSRRLRRTGLALDRMEE